MAKIDKLVATRNSLLALFPVLLLEKLLPQCRLVKLDAEQVVQKQGERIERTYFPLNCVISAVTEMEKGAAIEVASIGKEGAVGLLGLSGFISANVQFTQVAGEALHMDAEGLEEFARSNDGVHDVLMRYRTAFVGQMSVSVACLGLHALPQRCARWLLVTHDRLDQAPDVPLTHKFLSMMLGVRRAGVTEALQALRERGAITYRRGVIRVKDRRRLEKAACQCYRRVKDLYDEMLPGSDRTR